MQASSIQPSLGLLFLSIYSHHAYMGILTDLSNKRCLSNEAMIGKEQMTAFAVLASVSADGGAIDPII